MGLNRGMKTTLIALLAMGLCLPLMAADEDKPLPKDFKSLKALAEKGDTEAQFILGDMYAKGRGVKQDFKKGLGGGLKRLRKGMPMRNTSLGSCIQLA